MKRLVLIAALLVVPAAVSAQGVNDPSTPNNRFVIVNQPSQPSRPTATRNIPTGIQAPPLGARYPARTYRPGAHGSGNRR